ncbi:GreA/GreB family elongation factor [Cupriavidus pauculus]|uniref:GreA/GreB family elongation factor n=1 Tax=Cupriavidus pauculus TaxID=82633 RepID=UPI001247AFCF|nr:GreA/GreB family elongation factor [Cupriavidus pauculus]KAB0601039.1 GreA/GreB family elongation factor [Cupriavidus pauculus]UAL01969.1 GreA/GreB family elongation factor [Cupriavidus pauculus]
MRAFEIEISKPANADSFENMCTDVYGVVFEDPTPKRNGRSGQKQGGVDIFVMSNAGRVGIQCKRYVDGGVTTRTVDDEVAAADAAGWKIARLIIATTAASDTALVSHAQLISDARQARGQFTVEVESWTEICNHIQRHDALHPKYSPNSPGGAIAALRAQGERTEAQIAVMPATMEATLKAALMQMLPMGRPDSPNGIVTRQLDKVNDLLRTLEFKAAQEMLAVLETDIENFDPHQKARWTLQNGIAHWQQNREEVAAEWFLRAYDIFADDERIAANKIRAHIIQGDLKLANAEGKRLLCQFPHSLHVWLASTNARICEQEDLSEASLPARYRDEADALQMMAYAFYRQRSDLAVTYARRALTAKNAGLFTRKGAAGIIVGVAGRHGVLAEFDAYSQPLREGLAEVIRAFEPAASELWRIENDQHRAEAAAHVALAHMLTGAPGIALSMCERIESEIPEYAERIAALHVGALRFLQRYDDVIRFAMTHLDALDDDGLLIVAETAANQGNAEAFACIIHALQEYTSENKPVLKLLGLVCRCNSGESEQVLQEISEMPVDGFDLITLNAFAGFMFNANRATEALRFVEAIKSRISRGGSASECLIVVDTLIRAEALSDAVALLESVDSGIRSLPIQRRRLRALLLSGHRRKSKDLLEKAPPEWLSDDAFRRLAMSVAQEANDWSALERLTKLHREAHPGRAEAWVHWYQVVLHTRPPAQIRNAFSEAPEHLTGTPKQIAKLATAELKYGRPEHGYARLYRMFRSNMEDVAAASAYLTAVLMGHRPSQGASGFPVVTPGSWVTLEGADKSVVKIVIDPFNMTDLPKAARFLAADSSLAKQLIGRERGDSVEVAGAFDVRNFTIVEIGDAHHGLGEHAHELFSRSLEPAPDLHIFTLAEKEDGGLDVTPIHEQLKAQSRHSKTVMEQYAESQLPLGFCARMMGAGAMQLVFGWDQRNPPLASGVSSVQEFDAAMSLLRDRASPVVVDAITLAELVRFEQGKLLSTLGRVYVCRGTYDRFKQAEVEALDSRTVAHAADIDGQFAFLPVTEDAREWKARQYTEALRLIETYCEICPVYGPEQTPNELLLLKDLLDTDTYDALALCLEKGAALLSIDERLRSWAKGVFGIKGLFPYLLAMKSLSDGAISRGEHASFILGSALHNRSIFALHAEDILWGLQQPDLAIKTLELASTHLAMSLNRPYAIGLARDLLLGIPSVSMQYGAAAEVVKFVAYGLFRRKDNVSGTRDGIAYWLRQVASLLFPSGYVYPTACQIPNKECADFFSFLEDGLEAGITLAQTDGAIQSPEIAALYCSTGFVAHRPKATTVEENALARQ